MFKGGDSAVVDSFFIVVLRVFVVVMYILWIVLFFVYFLMGWGGRVTSKLNCLRINSYSY